MLLSTKDRALSKVNLDHLKLQASHRMALMAAKKLERV
jgi:hypothetical protein